MTAADDPGYTERGERAEQSAFVGEGEYSGGGFAGGPEELHRTDSTERTDRTDREPDA